LGKGLRNFRKAKDSLKLLRKFYSRLGWNDKVEEVDEEFYTALEERNITLPSPKNKLK
jgi:hypothetical protein